MRTLLDILAEILGVGRAQFCAESRQRARRWGLVTISSLCALWFTGCGTVAGYEINTNRHLIHVTLLAARYLPAAPPPAAKVTT